MSTLIPSFVRRAARAIATAATPAGVASAHVRTSVRKGLSVTLAITTIVWALGVPLSLLVPQPVRAADIASTTTATPSSSATSAMGVTYTGRFSVPSPATSGSSTVRAFYIDLNNVTGISSPSISTCSLSITNSSGQAVGDYSQIPLQSCSFQNGYAVLSMENTPVNLSANEIVTFVIGSFTHGSSAVTNASVTVAFSTAVGGTMVANAVDTGAVTRSIVASGSVPALIGGGPADAQNFVPLEAVIDVNLASGSFVTTGPAAPNTTNVTLYPCTGATDATTCTTPDTSSNRCTSVTIGNAASGGSDNKITCAATLAASTTYKFTVNGRVTNTSNVALGASVNRIFRTSSVSSASIATVPRVQSRVPERGAMSVPTNTAIAFVFPTGPEGNMLADGSANAVNTLANVRIKTITNGIFGSNICTLANGCSSSWDSGSRTLRVNGVTLTAGTQYDVCLASNVRNAQSVALGADDCGSFTTGSGADGTAPTLATSNPLNPAHGATSVDPAITGSIRATFSEALRPETITTTNIKVCNDTDGNGDSICDAGEAIAATAYTPTLAANGIDVIIGLNAALAASKRFCLSFGTGLKDLAGNAVASAIANKCFTTGAASAVSAPTLISCDADTYAVACKFDQPMAEGDLITSGNVNTSNVALECPTGVPLSLSNKAATYNAEFRELKVTSLGLQPAQTCKITVTNARGFQGTAISTSNSANIAQFIVRDAATTGGFIGESGSANQDFASTTNFATFWENPERCEPRTRVTSKSTVIECEFKAPAALAAGSTLTLTFPEGFTYSDASGNTRAVPAASSFANTDVNGPGSGAPTVSASCNATARTCTVTTATATIASGDRVTFHLDRITTPSTPVSDKRITVLVKNSSGVQVTTLNPTPFSIAQGGDYSISGKVCKSTTTDGDCADGGDTGIANLKLFCNQMGGFGTTGAFAGSQETTTDGDGAWSITGLSNGQYGCSLPPDPTAFGNVMGGNDWRNVTVSGANVSNVDFDYQDLDATGQSLAITFTGSAALASKKLDVFCNAGSSDFRFSAPIMKVVTLDGSGNGTATMKLLGGKTYDCGVGPHMDFSAFSSGGPPPVPEFDFLPPPFQRVNVVEGTDPSGVTFTLTAASNTITVNVCDGGTNDASNCGTASKGTGIANVYVNAAPMGCFNTDGSFKACFGGFAQTNTNGIATLKVSPGEYEVMANSPGLPPGDPVAVTVLTDGTVQQKGTTVTQVTIKIAKSSTTISGQILDESGNGIQYAHVNGERIVAGGSCSSFSPAGGWRDSPTDSSGNYSLYVSDGTWNVRAFAPAYGEVGCTTVVISGSSASGKNVQATAGDYGTLTGTCPDGSFIGAFGTTGGNNSVCSEGTYSLKMKTGTYAAECHAPGSGSCGRSTSQSVTSGGTTTVNFGTTITTGTVAVTITGITDAWVDLRDSAGQGNGTGQNTSGVYTIKLPPGTYTIRGGSPKYGELCSEQSVTVTASTTTAKTCTPPSTLRSITGRITDGTSNIAGATVTLSDSNGKIFNATAGAQAGSNANLSLTNVPDGTYTLRASKKGYGSALTTATVSGGNLTLSSPVAMTPTSGSSGEAVSIPTQASGSTFTGSGRVIATTGSGSSTTTVVADIDSTNGQASLDLPNGTWTVKAYGDNGKVSPSSTVTVSNGSLSGSAPTLAIDTAISGFTSKSDSPTMTPKSGANISSATVSPVSGKSVGVTIPAGALSTSDSSTGKVEMKLDSTVAGIDPGADLDFIGAQGIQITPQDANGNTLGGTSLYSNATLQIPYTDADVTAAGVDESKLVVGAINTNGEWEAFSTTVDTTNNILTATVTHFSTFGVLGGGSSGGAPSSSDVTPPAAPTNITSSATEKSVTLTWKDPTDGDLKEIEVLRNAPPSSAVSGTPVTRIAAGVQKFIDTAVSAATKYFYILRVKDTNGNTRNSGTIEITTASTGTTTPTSGTTSTTPAATTGGGSPAVTMPTSAAPTAPGATAIGLSAGDLVQGATSKAVYLVGADGKRYVYSNEGTYKSWHADFTKVKKISDADLASLQLGGFVTIRPGTWLVKIESDPKVYAVEPGGALRWVETEARAKKLYGATWNQKIVDVPVSFWVGYRSGAALGADQHPSGTLIASGGSTYYIDAGKKLLVTSDVFASHGFQNRFVHALDASIVYGDGTPLATSANLRFASE